MDSEEDESKLNQKILLGPGPSNVPCRILNALSQSPITAPGCTTTAATGSW